MHASRFVVLVGLRVAARADHVVRHTEDARDVIDRLLTRLGKFHVLSRGGDGLPLHAVGENGWATLAAV